MYFDDPPKDLDRDDYDPYLDKPWEQSDQPWLESAADEPAEKKAEPACPEASGWRRALLALCRAVTGWLDRFGHPLLAALGVAFLAGMAGWIGGPLAEAGSGLAASALDLAQFASNLQSGSDLLPP